VKQQNKHVMKDRKTTT